MKSQYPVDLVLLVMVFGCGPTVPDRGLRTGGAAPVPPWLNTSSDRAKSTDTYQGGLILNAIWVPPGKTTTIDGPAKARSLIIGANARVDAKSLTDVSVRIVVAEGAILTAPNLRSCGKIVVGMGAEVVAPALFSAGGIIVGTEVDVERGDSCLSGGYGGRSDTGVAARDKGARLEVQSLAMLDAPILVGDGATMVAPALHLCRSQLGNGAKLDSPCAPKTPPRSASTWSGDRTEFSECF